MKKPAFSGILPSQFNWSKASTFQFNFISRISCISTISNLYSRTEMGSDELEGFYKLELNGKFYFVKVVPSHFSSSLLAGEKISSWLSQHSLSSVVCIRGFPVHDLISDLSIFMYPFYDFRYCQPSTYDLTKIGTYVARMHVLLANYPNSSELRLSSWRNHELILRTLKKFDDTSILYSAQTSIVSQILCSIDDQLFDSVLHDPQPIHGDLNGGNLLFDVSSSSIFALDFEESSYAFYSCWYDLVFVIQRFIIAYPTLDHFALIDSLLSAYRLVKPLPLLPFEGSLLATLKFISVRSILVLLSSPSSSQQNTSFKLELQKFISLYNRSFDFSDLFCSIELKLL